MSALDTNIEKLNGLLDRFRETGIRNRIAGEDRDGSAWVFPEVSPLIQMACRERDQ